ncbi:MAG TPA: glycosyltransferase family 39 protein [Verrucomicrobiae bacterium]|nr:glycosyltransferase family 39 protein [Verrucomicrobiae bacterium]
MPFLQEIIHKLEVGSAGPRYLRYTLTALVALALLVFYNLRVAKNFGTQEAMDSAQLARNISEGKGYTTSFVRPLSIYLLTERAKEKAAESPDAKVTDPARLKTAHPDISNPPVYPVVLAGLMKVLPFHFEVAKSKPFWSSMGRFTRYQPDFLIAWFNEILFFAIIALTFLWARRLFDNTIAITSAILLFGSEVLWKFSASGLSTILLMLITLGLIWTLTLLLEDESSEKKRDPMMLLILAIATGALVGLGGLTRYGFATLIVPAVVIITLFAGERRVSLALITTAAFFAVFVPWLFRNHNLTGTLFGTTGYGIIEGAALFPGDRLERSLDPAIAFSVRGLWMKLLINSRLILQNEFFTFGGGWLIALFLVGLMVSFRNPTIRRMRYFLLGGLGMLFVVQALARTQLSEDEPGINTENFLILLLPLIVVYAVSFFFLLLEQIQVAIKQVRYVVLGVFVTLSYLPLAFALLPPRSTPLAYPPYYPPIIQEMAGCFKESELIMSDVPWAVAWYGDRQCVWLTLDAFPDSGETDGGGENFFAINDLKKTIYGLYLTPKTLDMHYQSDIIRGGAPSWGSLILKTMLTKDTSGKLVVPAPFPLRQVAPGYLPEQMFLTDWPRWDQVKSQ